MQTSRCLPLGPVSIKPLARVQVLHEKYCNFFFVKSVCHQDPLACLKKKKSTASTQEQQAAQATLENTGSTLRPFFSAAGRAYGETFMETPDVRGGVNVPPAIGSVTMPPGTSSEHAGAEQCSRLLFGERVWKALRPPYAQRKRPPETISVLVGPPGFPPLTQDVSA